MNILVTETLFPKCQPKGWSEIGDTIVLEDRIWDYISGRVEVNWTFIQQKKQATYHNSIRIYTYREVINLLRQNGFEHFVAFGSLSKDAFQFGAQRLLITARRI